MASAIKKFTAVRKPIYCAEISVNGRDFNTMSEAVNAFKQRFPEYKDCKYDSECNLISGECIWKVRLYRECAIDFI